MKKKFILIENFMIKMVFIPNYWDGFLLPFYDECVLLKIYTLHIPGLHCNEMQGEN